MRKGERVWLKEPFWYKNENLGGWSGVIICTESYILINVQGYHSNPVKCFRNEISSEKQPLKEKTT